MNLTLNLFAGAAALIATASSLCAEKYALLVAIEDYPNGISDLIGCHNDLLAVKGLLKTKYGFEEKNIKVLLDAKATTPAVKDGIVKHLGKAKPGDAAFFYYSGHGTHVPDLNRDEGGDGRDEAIVTYDINPKVPSTWLTDDKIGSALRHVRTKRLTVVFDMCHAGTSTRSVEPEKPDPKFGISKYQDFDFSNLLYFAGDQTKGSGLVTKSSVSKPYHFFAACSADETSLLLGEYVNGKRRGFSLFTKHFVQRMKDSTDDSLVSGVASAVRNDVSKVAKDMAKRRGRAHTQTPVWEGNSTAKIGDVLIASTSGGASIAREDLEEDVEEDAVHQVNSIGKQKFVLKLNRKAYKSGDSVAAYVTSEAPGYLYIIYVNAKNEVSLLYPNKLSKSNAVKPAAKVRVPGAMDKFRLKISGEAGFEAVKAIISSEPILALDELAKQESLLIGNIKTKEGLSKLLRLIETKSTNQLGVASLIYEIK